MWKVLVLFLLCSFSLWLLTIGKCFSCKKHFFLLLSWKKHAPSSLKRKSDGYETVGTSWYWDLFHLLLSSSEGFFFFVENIVITQNPSSKNYSICSYSPVSFFKHVTVLFHLYTFFKFLESFAHCVLVSASLRNGFSQNENIAYLSILYERIILFSFSPK